MSNTEPDAAGSFAEEATSLDHPTGPTEPPTDLDGAGGAEPPTDLDGVEPGGWHDAQRMPEDLARRYVRYMPMRAGAQAFPFRAETAQGDLHVVRLPRGSASFADVEGLLELDHPNLVRIVEQGRTTGRVPYQILEHVPGESLVDSFATRQPWAPQDVRRLLEQLVDAIDELLQMGFVHSDITPANIVCDRTGLVPRYVVVDYGLSYRAEHTVMEGVGGRTERYTPPEAFVGFRSRAWDWWSLGMIVAQALLGRHPLDGADVRHVKLAITLGRFDVTDITDPRWQSLVSGLLTVDFDDRWGSEQVRAWLAGRNPRVAGPTTDRGGRAAPAPFRFGGRTFRSEPRRLADAMGSEWEEAARALGTPIVRTELARWCAQFGDADLLTVVGSLGAGDATPDQDLIRLVGALYGVPLEGGDHGRGRGRTWYQGTVMTPVEVRRLCARALAEGEALRGWSGALSDLSELESDVEAAIRPAVAFAQGDLRVLGEAAGPASPMAALSRDFEAGRALLRAWTDRLVPPREAGEEVVWALELLGALTSPIEQRALAEEARIATRWRWDLRRLVGPRSSTAHHLAAIKVAERTRRRGVWGFPAA